ncbi:hypothetical protein pb186bvf_000694 [Paramecium bursaria]
MIQIHISEMIKQISYMETITDEIQCTCIQKKLIVKQKYSILSKLVQYIS